MQRCLLIIRRPHPHQRGQEENHNRDIYQCVVSETPGYEKTVDPGQQSQKYEPDSDLLVKPYHQPTDPSNCNKNVIDVTHCLMILARGYPILNHVI